MRFVTKGSVGWFASSPWGESPTIASQRSALHTLSDHVLKDIGLSRGDIDFIAGGSHRTGRRTRVRRRR